MLTVPVTLPVPEPSINAVWSAVDKSLRLPFVASGPLQSNTPLRLINWLFRISPLLLLIVRLLICGGAVNRLLGNEYAAPAVFPNDPKARLVLGLVVMVPVVLTIGVSEFWKVSVLFPTPKVPEVSVRIPFRVTPVVREMPLGF